MHYVTPTYTYDQGLFIVSYETIEQAIQNSSLYPEVVFKRKKNTFVCNHQDYLNYLDNPQRFTKENSHV